MNVFRKTAAPAAALIGLIAISALFPPSHGIGAQGINGDEVRIKHGLVIAPVALNLAGKDPSLIGMGSYLVNAVGDCNGCHSAGAVSEFTPTGNPYLLIFNGKVQVNTATYLAGGNDFGPFPGPGPFPHVVSRNLTPDKFGLPAGHTFSDFLSILRTGKDFDNAHPDCSSTPDGMCVPAPINGALLQIMPWAALQNMTEHDIRAIYEYLSAVPCIEGDPGVPALPGTQQLRCH